MTAYTNAGGPLNLATSFAVGGTAPLNPPWPGDIIDFPTGTVTFDGTDATADFGAPLATAGAINDFANNELIVLSGVPASSIQYAGATQVVRGTGGAIGPDVAVGYSQGEFSAVPLAAGDVYRPPGCRLSVASAPA